MGFEITRLVYGEIEGVSPYTVPNITFTDAPFTGTPYTEGGITWNGTNKEFTVPDTGVYEVIGWVTLNLGQNAPGDPPGAVQSFEHLLAVAVNGVTTRYIGSHPLPVGISGTAIWLNGSAFIRLNAGDRVKLQHWQHSGVALNAYSGAKSHYFQVIKHSY